MTDIYPHRPSAPSVGGKPVYDRMKRHEILVLRRAGLTLREVARKAGVGLRTVKRILQQDDLDPPPRRPVGRPPIALTFEEEVRRILATDGELPTVEVLRRLRERGYSGGKNPVYQLVRRLRATVTSPLVRFEGVAGEFRQCDFGHVRVRYDDGSVELLHFFASRLKWSRWVHVELVPNEQVEALVRSLLVAFASLVRRTRPRVSTVSRTCWRADVARLTDGPVVRATPLNIVLETRRSDRSPGPGFTTGGTGRRLWPLSRPLNSPGACHLRLCPILR